MKLKFFSILIFVSAAALAYPTVNDSVIYNGKFTAPDGSITVAFIQELQITELNKETNKIKIVEILYGPNGSESNETRDLDFTEIKTKDQVLELLKNCEAAGGEKQQLEVSGGVFETCYFHDDKKNEIWIGDVPFNTVKQVQFDDKGSRIEIELALFSEGT